MRRMRILTPSLKRKRRSSIDDAAVWERSRVGDVEAPRRFNGSSLASARRSASLADCRLCGAAAPTKARSVPSRRPVLIDGHRLDAAGWRAYALAPAGSGTAPVGGPNLLAVKG